MSVDDEDFTPPFSISCRSCDAGTGLTEDEAIAEGWIEIESFPEGLAENFLGLCPDCLQETLMEEQ